MLPGGGEGGGGAATSGGGSSCVRFITAATLQFLLLLKLTLQSYQGFQYSWQSQWLVPVFACLPDKCCHSGSVITTKT